MSDGEAGLTDRVDLLEDRVNELERALERAAHSPHSFGSTMPAGQPESVIPLSKHALGLFVDGNGHWIINCVCGWYCHTITLEAAGRESDLHWAKVFPKPSDRKPVAILT
jgi:hypothetical protein